MKSRYTTFSLLVLAGIAALFCGCQTTVEPVTGRKQRFMTSMAEETQLGLKSWGEVVAQEKPCTDARKTDAVRRVGEALRTAINQPDFQWEFRVFASTQANAFCLPGGKVAVYDGLFRFVANDAELAAVMGHEIAHAVARHGGERMSEQMLVGLGASGLSMVLGQKAQRDKEVWMAAYAGLTTVGFMLPFSRTHEYSADQIGMVYMAKAGFNPQGALDFWAKFSQQNKSSGGLGAMSEFLSTHPLDSKRIENLRSILPRATVEYGTAPVRRGLGLRINP